MSNEEAEAIEAKFERKWAKEERDNFLNRMDRKLRRKERFNHY